MIATVELARYARQATTNRGNRVGCESGPSEQQHAHCFPFLSFPAMCTCSSPTKERQKTRKKPDCCCLVWRGFCLLSSCFLPLSRKNAMSHNVFPRQFFFHKMAGFFLSSFLSFFLCLNGTSLMSGLKATPLFLSCFVLHRLRCAKSKTMMSAKTCLGNESRHPTLPRCTEEVRSKMR